MSPRTTAAGRRRLSRTPAYERQDRRALAEAVVAVAVILVGTAIALWGMRPGGIADRQPRVTVVVVGVVLLTLLGGRFLTTVGRRFHDQPVVGWGIALGVALVAGLVATLAWPGGLVDDGDPTPTTRVDPLEGELPLPPPAAPEAEEAPPDGSPAP